MLFVLCRAAQTFDGRGSFSGWATWCMQHHTLTLRREAFRKSLRRCPYQLPTETRPDDSLDLGDEVRPLLSRLTERERYVIRQSFWESRPQTKIAESIGISKTRVGQIYQDALAKMKAVA